MAKNIEKVKEKPRKDREQKGKARRLRDVCSRYVGREGELLAKRKRPFIWRALFAGTIYNAEEKDPQRGCGKTAVEQKKALKRDLLPIAERGRGKDTCL